jgi:phosphomannomutase / phosphoglucomutase
MTIDPRSSAEIFAQFPDNINTPELNIVLEEDENFIFIERMFAEANFRDCIITAINGVWVDFV